MTVKEQEHIFKDWLGQYKGLFFKIVRAYAVTSMDMDDLFQEVVLQVWKSVPAFKGASSVSTWVYRIAINTAINWTRSQRRHQRTVGFEEAGDGRGQWERQRGEVPGDGEMGAIGQGVETGRILVAQQGMQEDPRLIWLYEQIHQMDGIDRSITLLLLEGFSYKEMAVIIGISETNVGVKINRIKKKLIARSEKQDRYGT